MLNNVIEQKINAIQKDNKLCETHGNYTSMLITGYGQQFWTRCPACIRNKSNEDVKELQLRNLAESNQNIMKTLINRAAVPDSFINATFDNYQLEDGENQRKVVEHCKYFADNFAKAKARNIHGILSGNTGTGKTHLSCAIVKRVLEIGFSAIFVTMADISLSIRSSYKDEGKSERQIIEEFTDIDLLIIDECAIKITSFEQETLFNIVNKRYSSCKPTLVLTNKLNSLTELLGERTASRLQASGFVQVFDWQDHRLKGLK